MKNDKKQNDQGQPKNIDKTTDKSGLHVKNKPKGAEKMDSSFSNGKYEEGSSSKYANTSDNENYKKRS